MNAIDVNGNWNELKAILNRKFADLTDNDIIKKEKMLDKLEASLGKSKEELQKIITGL